MELTYEPLTLELRNTFRIAHGASDQRHNVLVRLADAEGYIGLGEAAAVTYHGETQQGIMAYLQDVAGILEDAVVGYLDDVLEKLPLGSQAARAAVDIALHDLWGQRLGQPLYRLWGLNPERIPPTSFTIAMDTPAAMAERARQANWPVLKIKVGGPDDVAMLSAIRQSTSTKIRVDANAGWTRKEAAERIPRLSEYGLEMVEQPLPVGDIEGLRWLKKQDFGVPIFADESIKTTADVIAHAGAVDGVVIKVMKTGGLCEAYRAITVAHALGMQVMLSCMIESSVGVTAAAHLAPMCESVDLDGPLLIANDRFQGIHYDGTHLHLPNIPGTGVREI